MDAASSNLYSEPAQHAHARPVSATARGGFTLVELLMVLCVLVVLTATALPAVLRWQKGMPMEQAISILQLQLQQTRLAAVRSGESWIMVLPERDNPGYRRPASSSAGSHTESRFVLPAGIRCGSLSDPRAVAEIICHADGTVSGCRLEIRDSDGRRTIMEIDRLTGTVRIVPLQTAAVEKHRSNELPISTTSELRSRSMSYRCEAALRGAIPC